MNRPLALGLACTAALAADTRAAQTMPYCGSAIMTLEEGHAFSIGWLDACFTDFRTREQTLSSPAPGDGSMLRLSGVPGTLGTSTIAGTPGTPGVVRVTDPMRPFGSVPTPPAPDTYPGVPGNSRSRQLTTLTLDPADVLNSWTPSNDAFGVFVGNSSLGEQIAFTGMQRWGGPFTGVLVYGDFALRHVPGRAGTVAADGTLSGLVLTTNIDFLDSSFADLANATITSDGQTLSISGDLLISGALFVLDSSAVVGTRFGTFSMTACLAKPDVNADARTDVEDLYTWEAGAGARDVDASGTVDNTDRRKLLDIVRCRETEDVNASQR